MAQIVALITTPDIAAAVVLLIVIAVAKQVFLARKRYNTGAVCAACEAGIGAYFLARGMTLPAGLQTYVACGGGLALMIGESYFCRRYLASATQQGRQAQESSR